jgi:hypothetical protein
MLANLLLVLSFFLSVVPLFADPEITARFEPERIESGSRAQLIIRVVSPQKIPNDFTVSAGELPLRRIQAVHQVDGEGHVESTLLYLAEPKCNGVFHLDASAIPIEGQLFPLPAAELTVAPSPPSAQNQGIEGMSLTVENIPRHIYVGEMISVEIVLRAPEYLRFRVQGHPQKIGDGFLLGNPADPFLASMEQIRAGPSPEQCRWRTLLTAHRQGSLSIAFATGVSVDLSVKAVEPAIPIKGWMAIFQASSPWEPAVVVSPNYGITAVPLPLEGRPSDFSGAIGNFTLLPPETHDLGQNGEGRCYEIVYPVRGIGNLAIIAAPTLPTVPGWQLQTVRKRSNPDDRLGHGGTIEFRYTFIRSDAKAPSPPFVLHYFNTASACYESLQHTPQLPSDGSN